MIILNPISRAKPDHIHFIFLVAPLEINFKILFRIIGTRFPFFYKCPSGRNLSNYIQNQSFFLFIFVRFLPEGHSVLNPISRAKPDPIM